MSQAAVVRSIDANPVIGVLLRLFALPVVGFLGFGVTLALGIAPNRIPVLGLAIVLTTLILSVIAVDRMRPRERRNLLFSIFSFVYLLVFVLPVFAFYLGEVGYTPDASPSPVPLTPEVVTRGLLAALVAYTLLLIGYALPVGGMVANVVPRMRREWSLGTALTVALVMLPLGWSVRLANEFGLIPERAGSGFLGAISSATSFGIALLALCYQRYRSRGALLLMFIMIPPTMIFGFFTGSKTQFLMPLVMVVVVHLVVTRRLRAWWVVGFFVFMSLYYPVAQVYRHYAWGSGLSTLEALADSEKALKIIERSSASSTTGEHMKGGLEATAHRLNGLGILSVIMRDAGTRVPFQGGWSLAYIPASYIPRVVWPGKPKFTTGQWVTSQFGYGPQVQSSTGATWTGELYFNFGWTGIVLGMIFLGVWFRFLQESFLGMDATLPALMAGVVSILALCTKLDGDMLGATNEVVFNLWPIVFTHLIVRAVTPSPARMPRPQ